MLQVSQLAGFGGQVAAPDTTPPTITSTNSASVSENATLSKSLTADEAVTWSIVGGADQTQFEISGSTLRWSSNGTRDYESPADADTDNAYVVDVRATDGSANTTDQTITVTVTDVVATWDPATIASVTLSGSDLIATSAGGSGTTQGAHVAAANGQTAGKYYIEVTFTAGLGGANYGAGVGTTAATYANMGNNALGGNMVFRSGNIYTNGSNSGSSLGARSAGDVIGVAIDLDNRKFWVKKVSGTPGNWNNSGSDDPATNTGGKTIPSGTMVPFCTFGGAGGSGSDVITLNPGISGLTGTAPSGFSAWPH